MVALNRDETNGPSDQLGRVVDAMLEAGARAMGTENGPDGQPILSGPEHVHLTEAAALAMMLAGFGAGMSENQVRAVFEVMAFRVKPFEPCPMVPHPEMAAAIYSDLVADSILSMVLSRGGRADDLLKAGGLDSFGAFTGVVCLAAMTAMAKAEGLDVKGFRMWLKQTVTKEWWDNLDYKKYSILKDMGV